MTLQSTVRPTKVSYIKDTFPDAGDKLEIVEMQDLVTGDWTEPLQGISIIIWYKMEGDKVY